MKRLRAHRFRRTTLVAVFCGAVLGGVCLSRIIGFPFASAMAAMVLFVALFRKRTAAVLAVAIIAGLCSGGWRGTVMARQVARYDGLYDQKVTIVGRAGEDASYGKQTQLKFDLKNVRAPDGTPLAGAVGVSGFGENMIFRGDTVEVIGKLRPGSGSRQAWLSYGQLHVLKRDHSLVESVRRRFNAGMLSALPEPLGSFAMGLLIGQRTSLPDSVYQDLLMVGLVHIIAVSGYNLTIILRAGMRLFGRRSKFQTMAFSVALIALFLLLTGSSASIVRAAVVSGLGLLVWYYGRAFKPLVLLLLAAAGTALASPLYVWGDMGWYLSFLAFYGVLVLAPALKSRFVPARFHGSLLVSVALESLCAEIMTLPAVLLVFGQMSLVSLPANLLIATLVPLAMLVSVAAGLAGMLLFPVAGWLAWPATMVLTYMLDMAHVLARIPHIFLQNLRFSLLGLIVSYLLLASFNFVVHSHLKRKRAIITVVNEEAEPSSRRTGRRQDSPNDNFLTA